MIYQEKISKIQKQKKHSFQPIDVWKTQFQDRRDSPFETAWTMCCLRCGLCSVHRTETCGCCHLHFHSPAIRAVFAMTGWPSWMRCTPACVLQTVAQYILTEGINLPQFPWRNGGISRGVTTPRFTRLGVPRKRGLTIIYHDLPHRMSQDKKDDNLHKTREMLTCSVLFLLWSKWTLSSNCPSYDRFVDGEMGKPHTVTENKMEPAYTVGCFSHCQKGQANLCLTYT